MRNGLIFFLFLSLLGCSRENNQPISSQKQSAQEKESLFFVANNGVSGKELYLTDGNKIQLVRDINATPNTSRTYYHPDIYGYTDFIKMGTNTYFVADDGIHGGELWKTDGTPDGTQLVVDAIPGSVGSYPTQMSIIKSGQSEVLYFFAFKDTRDTNGRMAYPYHRTLWKSDGTKEGTVEIGGDWSQDDYHELLRPVQQIGNTLLIFFGYDIYNYRLWTLDVSSPSQTPVFRQGGIGNFSVIGDTVVYISRYVSSYPATNKCTLDAYSLRSNNHLQLDNDVSCSLQAFGNYVYFEKLEPTSNVKEMWRTDGNSIKSIKDLYPGFPSKFPYFLGVINDKLVFNAGDPGARAVYDFDGNSVHTITNAELDGVDIRVDQIYKTDSYLYFSAITATGKHLFRTNGQASLSVIRIKPKYNSMSRKSYSLALESAISEADNGFFFVDGYDLYFSNGDRDSGTKIAFHTDTQVESISIYGFPIAVGSEAVFIGQDSANSWATWSTDSSGRLKKLAPYILPDSGVDYPIKPNFMPGSDCVYFYGWDDIHESELWSYDGKSAQMVKDVNPSTKDSIIHNLVSVGKVAYFTTEVNFFDSVLWRATALPLGVEPFPLISDDLDAKTVNYYIKGVFGDAAYIIARDAKNMEILWKVDQFGHTEQIIRNTVFPNNLSFNISNISNEHIYLTTNETGFSELWRYDRALKKLLKLFTETSAIQIQWTDLVGSDFYYSLGSNLASNDTQIWTIAAHSAEPRQIVQDAGSQRAHKSTDDVLYFTDVATNGGVNLWAIDNTNKTRKFIKQLAQREQYYSLYDLKLDRDALYFFTDDSKDNYALWKTNGTDGSTQLVTRCSFPDKTILSGLMCVIPLKSYEGYYYYLKAGNDSQWHLWRTINGDTEGRQFTDLSFGPTSNYPSDTFRIVGDRAVFVANDGVHGNELWQTDGTIGGTKILQDLYPGEVTGLGYGDLP